MAAKKNSLASHQSSIDDLLKKLEEEKAKLKEYEEKKKAEIGKLYFDLLSIDNKNIDVDEVVSELKEQIKIKRKENQKSKNNQNADLDDVDA
jgi:hypothetical protein